MTAAEFMAACGSRIFGESWRWTDLKETVERPWSWDASTAAGRKAMLQHRILTALSLGEITAEVHLVNIDPRAFLYRVWRKEGGHTRFFSKHPERPPPERSEDEEEDSSETEPEKHEKMHSKKELIAAALKEEEEELIAEELHEFEREVPDHVRPRVQAEFWKVGESTIDWPRSQVEIPSINLRIDKTGEYNRDIALDEHIVERGSHFYVLYFRNAKKAISVITKAPSILTKPWGGKLSSRVTIFWPEIIAAIWRKIAIDPPKDERGRQDRLVQYVNAYLAEQGYTYDVDDEMDIPSVATIRNVVHEVLLQWDRKSLDSSVLVNSGRPIPERARHSLPRAKKKKLQRPN